MSCHALRRMHEAALLKTMSSASPAVYTRRSAPKMPWTRATSHHGAPGHVTWPLDTPATRASENGAVMRSSQRSSSGIA